MSFIEEQFLSYEYSLIMKELGFSDPCFGWYNKEKNLLIYYLYNVDQMTDDMILAPQYKQFFKWVEKKYDIISYFTFERNSWVYNILGYDFVIISELQKNIEIAELECLKKIFKIIQKDGKKIS